MNVSMNEYRTGNNQKETGKLLWHMHSHIQKVLDFLPDAFFLNSVARSLRSQVCLFSVARSQIFNTGPIHEQGECIQPAAGEKF